ncbi:MAG: hypothetical protein LUF85_06455 [Bacteroides sp.]|nr:hypothetical protein [Bacteroides sp.]
MKRSCLLSIALLFTLFIGFSCQQNRQKTETSGQSDALTDEQNRAGEYFFDGMFTYLADAASLMESATGKRIPVAMRGMFREVEEKYKEVSQGNGVPVYGQFMGTLVLKGEDEEGPNEQLLITGLIRFDKDRTSDKLEELTGNYRSAEQQLSLRPDHTYELRVKNGETEKGRWFLQSEHSLICVSGPNRTVMDINYVEQSFRSRDDNPVVYTYIRE